MHIAQGWLTLALGFEDTKADLTDTGCALSAVRGSTMKSIRGHGAGPADGC